MEGSGCDEMFWANGSLSYIFMAHIKHPHPSGPYWTDWELEFYLWAQVSICLLQTHSNVLPTAPVTVSPHDCDSLLSLSPLSVSPVLWAAESLLLSSHTHCVAEGPACPADASIYTRPLPWTPEEDASRVMSPLAWPNLTQHTPLYLSSWGFFS